MSAISWCRRCRLGEVIGLDGRVVESSEWSVDDSSKPSRDNGMEYGYGIVDVEGSLG
jgi:hypothetical protein